VQRKEEPRVDQTATTTLDGLIGSDHQNESLCYLENIHKVLLVIRAQHSVLSTYGTTAEVAEQQRQQQSALEQSQQLALRLAQLTQQGASSEEIEAALTGLRANLATESAAAELSYSDQASARGTQLSLLSRLDGFLDYSMLYVKYLKGSKKTQKTLTPQLAAAAAKAFPDLEGEAAEEASRGLYRLSSSQTSSLRKAPAPLRGAGVGGALAAMGGGEILYEEEMAAGKLKPGAALQLWWSQYLRLKGMEDGTTKSLNGRQVYYAVQKNRVASKVSASDTEGQGVLGHSVTFVRYDASNPKKIWYLQQWNNQLDSTTVGSDDSEYIVGANLSVNGAAPLTAELLLKDTKFKAGPAFETMKARVRTHKLDPATLASALVASIRGSDHAEATQLQEAASRLGTPSAVTHNLIRLIGLWQQAMGDLTVDGDFGNGSCRRLTGKALAQATELRAASPTTD
jgi:hypothetical protein